jgi:hypothetical protein
MKRGHFFKTSIPSIPKPVTSDMVFSSIHFRQQDRMDTKLFCEDLIDWNQRYWIYLSNLKCGYKSALEERGGEKLNFKVSGAE